MKSGINSHHQSFHITTNEVVVIISLLSFAAVVISVILIWKQLAYMKKQDKTNELLTDISTRVSAAITTHVGGTLALLNVGQIDLYIHGVSINGTKIFYVPSLYSPPAGDQSFKLLTLEPTIDQRSLDPGSYTLNIFLKDSLGRKWIVKGIADKAQNSRGFNSTTTLSVSKKNWSKP
jgi:hypothetical protein